MKLLFLTAVALNGCAAFDADLSYWDVSNVTDMWHMFGDYDGYNPPYPVGSRSGQRNEWLASLPPLPRLPPL